MGGKGSSFIHYPNGEIQELTGSPLYHTATIINSNIHSGGVSLQQTKEKEIYYILKSTFFLKNDVSRIQSGYLQHGED